MGRPKILVVEDNTDIRRLYAIGLNQRGFEVKLASNGAEAVTRVEDERPDMICSTCHAGLSAGLRDRSIRRSLLLRSPSAL